MSYFSGPDERIDRATESDRHPRSEQHTRTEKEGSHTAYGRTQWQIVSSARFSGKSQW